jgi:hypothetical protein
MFKVMRNALHIQEHPDFPLPVSIGGAAAELRLPKPGVYRFRTNASDPDPSES